MKQKQHQLIPKILHIDSRGVIVKRKSWHENKRIEERPAVMAYLDKIKYALASGQVRINFQHERRVDQQRDIKYTNTQPGRALPKMEVFTRSWEMFSMIALTRSELFIPLQHSQFYLR